MELKTSSLKPGGLCPPDCDSDPEEKEISDDDDDDRNHKHRRRDTRSQSMEREQGEQVFTRPYRKWNKPFENGHSQRDNDSQSHYNADRDSKFQRRRFSHFSSDVNPRMKVNPLFSADIAPGRGRGIDWNQRDSRFNTVDASQMASSAIFPGRGLPNVTNAQGTSWNAFGLMPGIPNGGIDAIHPLGLQGPLRPPFNPSMTMGIPRQRCRDFEEQGFCLRGDMCPMEHGVNRIVVEDVQSLSQFNLPVSLPSAHLLGASPGSGLVGPTNSSTGTLINGRNQHGRASKPVMDDDGLGLGGGLSGEADVYDPDQPLWNHDCPEASTSLLALQPPNMDESDSFIDVDPSDRIIRSSGTFGSRSTSSSVWGRIRSSKSKMELKDKTDSRINSSDPLENRKKDNREAAYSVQVASGKRANANEIGAKAGDSSNKTPVDAGRNVRKTGQKAQRTLFVNCIPLKDNKKETLLLHFKKFGEVIDIYIPANSERAFVQFSKREDAESALKAPDAVMGNRFIKLWWANRDSIHDEGSSGGNAAPSINHDRSVAPVTLHPALTNKVKDSLQVGDASVNSASASESCLGVGNDGRAITAEGPKGALSHKRLENLEVLKEELRKKQEMLAQKRYEFRTQLDKLQKQSVGTKDEVLAELPAKRLKVETTDAFVKGECPKPADPTLAGASSSPELSADMSLSEPSDAAPSLKQAFRPVVHAGGSFPVNRYKLDNRPTAFKVNPPLPSELANVDALRDHFSHLGELSDVDLNYVDTRDNLDGANDSLTVKNCVALIRFKTRQAAEKAFLNGKTWQGHNLQFTWLAPGSANNNKKENSPAARGPAMKIAAEKQAHSTSQGSSNVRENSLVDAKGPQGAEVQSAEKSAYAMSLDSSTGTENSAAAIKATSGGDAQSACYIPLESNASEEGGESGIVYSEGEKDVQSSPIPLTGERLSPKGEIY